MTEERDPTVEGRIADGGAGLARPRIDDVSRRAGVSKTSVSFAFNQPENLNPATRDRILAVASELGYRPSPIARRLARRRTDQIGLVVPQSTHDIFANPFLPELVRGIGDVCDAEGIAVVIVPPVSGSIARAVDAALVQEPWGAVLETQGARLVANEKAIWEGRNYTSTVLTVNTKFAAQNPEVVKDLLRGHLAAIDFVKKSNAGAQKAVADQIQAFTGKRPNSAELFKALSRTKVTWDINLKPLAEYAQLNKEAGFARDVPDLNKFVNLSVIRGLAK